VGYTPQRALVMLPYYGGIREYLYDRAEDEDDTDDAALVASTWAHRGKAWPA
jgi:hypothetical protein